MTATAADLDDPFAAGVTPDELDDPFASAEDAKSSGTFVPWPGIEDVAERLVVLVPRTFDAEAKVSEYLQREYQMSATREEWKTDLVILDGGDLSYTYRAKVTNADGPDTFEEKTYEVAAAELPFLIPGWRVSWGNILGVLNKTSKLSTPLALGRIRAGYAIAEMRKGKTFEDFKAEQEAYYATIAKNPKAKVTAPKPRWHFEVSENPADKALAIAWWRAAKAAGYSLA